MISAGRALLGRPGPRWGARTLASAVLLRDHVGRILGDPEAGYFSARPEVVGKVDEPLSFKTMVGRSGYEYKVRELYESKGSSWLTPVELFQPHYGEALARYVLSDFSARQDASDGAPSSLRICEVGGGNGTLAANVLDYVREASETVYETMSYTVLDVSKALCERQEELVLSRGDGIHRDRFASIAADASTSRAWEDLGLGGGDDHVYVLGLEVLDNLPHDRVERVGGDWMETWVRYDDEKGAGDDGGGGGGTDSGSLELRPMADDRIARCFGAHDWVGEAAAAAEGGLLARLEAMLSPGGGPRAADRVVYLPTAAMAMVEAIVRCLPRHTLVLVDFDHLPDVQLEGQNAPLVSQTALGPTGTSRDAATLLVPVGSSDIFFPTKFSALKEMYLREAERGGSCRVESPWSFFLNHGDLQATTTMSGYNPMIEDFLNTKVFIGSRPALFKM